MAQNQTVPTIRFDATAFARTFAPLIAQNGGNPITPMVPVAPSAPIIPVQQTVTTQTPPVIVMAPPVEAAPPVERVVVEVVDDGVSGRQRIPATTSSAGFGPDLFQHIATLPNWAQKDIVAKLGNKKMTPDEVMKLKAEDFKKGQKPAAQTQSISTTTETGDNKSQSAEVPADTPQTPPQDQPGKPIKKPQREPAPEANSGARPFNAANFVVGKPTVPNPAPVAPQPAPQPQMFVGANGTPYMVLAHGSVWVPQQLYPGYAYPDGWATFKRQQRSEYIVDLLKQGNVIQEQDPTPGLTDDGRRAELRACVAFEKNKTLDNLSHEELVGLQRMIRSQIINNALQQTGYAYPKDSGFGYFMQAPKNWYTGDQQELQFYDWAFEIGLNDSNGNKTDECLVVLWRATPEFVADAGNCWINQHVTFVTKKVQPKK